MDKHDRRALVSFMTLVLDHLHPNKIEYPLQEIAHIDETEGDDSDKFREMPDYAVNAYYMQKAIDTITYEGTK